MTNDEFIRQIFDELLTNLHSKIRQKFVFSELIRARVVGSLCSRDFRAFPPGFLAGQRSGAGFFLLSSVPRRARSRTASVVAGLVGPKRVAPFPLPATVDPFSDFFPGGTSVPPCTLPH